jgi:hypothetical protein
MSDISSALLGPEKAVEEASLLEEVGRMDKRCLDVIPEESLAGGMNGSLGKDLLSKGQVNQDEEVCVDVKEELISQKQQIPDTRFSSRIQNQMLSKGDSQAPSKKRSLQGTSLTSKNSLAALDNEVIAELANSMGVNVSSVQFDTFDLMKDIEVARHAIDKV